MVTIYFACSITAGREFQPVYQAIVKSLIDNGHNVPTAHLADADIAQKEQVVAARVVYDRDVAWIQESDALIAEVSVPSHGVGYEIGFALQVGKKVLCLYQQGRRLSKMITGNPSPLLSINSYSTSDEAILFVHKFLDKLRLTHSSQ